MSGSSSERVEVVIARARSLLALMYSIDAGGVGEQHVHPSTEQIIENRFWVPERQSPSSRCRRIIRSGEISCPPSETAVISPVSWMGGQQSMLRNKVAPT
jgi:hypothetical protein